jgi:hypothetical protein
VRRSPWAENLENLEATASFQKPEKQLRANHIVRSNSSPLPDPKRLHNKEHWIGKAKDN